MGQKTVHRQERHRVNSLVFDFSISNQSEAIKVQKRVSTFLPGTVARIIDDYLGRYDQAGSIIRYDKVELNLGEIQVDMLESEVEERLPLLLEEYLTDKLMLIKYRQSESEMFSQESVTISAFEKFLLTGLLPENVGKNRPRDFGPFVWEMLKKRPVQFRQLLTKIKHDEASIERMASLIKNVSLSELDSLNLNALIDSSDEAVAHNSTSPTVSNEEGKVLLHPFVLCDQLECFLLTGQLPWDADAEAFLDMDTIVEGLLEESPDRFRQLLHKVLSVEDARKRLIFNLKEETLLLLIFTFSGVVKPVVEFIQSAALLLYGHLGQQNVPVHKKLLLYEFLLSHCIESWKPSFTDLFVSWVRNIAHPLVSQSEIDWNEFGRKYFESDSGVAEKAELTETIDRHINFVETESKKHSPAGVKATTLHRNATEKGADIWYIQNGGLILLWPYLARFFETLKLTEGNQFISREHQLRAVHELEFLIHGSGEYREYHLVLNKILCGIPLGMPLDPEFATQQANRSESNVLLRNAIEKWEIIGKTSLRGFRSSFLTRDGKLLEQDDGWKLTIDRKGFDVLLDRLPYPINVIKLPWMEKAMFVEW